MRAEQTSKVDNILISLFQICSAFGSGEPGLTNRNDAVVCGCVV